MAGQPCVLLGVYRQRAPFIAGMCRRGLHEMVGYNLRRRRNGDVYCGECKRIRLARGRARHALERYWRFLGMDSVR